MMAVRCALLTVFAVTSGVAAQTSSDVRRGPIIDMHLHAAAIRSDAHADSVLEWMDRHGVVRALMLVHDTAGFGWRERAPGRFLVAVSFPCHEGRYTSPQPCLPEWSGWPDPEWLRAQHAAGRLGALGELLNVYYGMSPADERLAPYFALAEDLDIPVGVHTGRGPPAARRAPGCCPNFDDDYGDPALLEPVLRRHPKLRVWLMHAGGPFLGEAIALMRAFPNVYADMSILNSMAPPAVEAHSLRAFLDAGLGDRIMLGTDNLPLERILERMDALDFLSEAQRRAILYDNAARFLRLDAAEIARDHEQAARTGHFHPATTSTDTVFVAPPTGERDTDRPSILAALEQVRPGGTVQFAAGTYLMGGDIIRVTVPRVTLLGHPEGTTLRGCDPGEFPWDNSFDFGNNCNAIELAAGQQTVRNLTFEHAMWALHVGCCWSDFTHMRAGEGGHLIEGNTFRSSSNAVRVHGFWSEPTVVRNNRLLNNWHSVQIYGGTVHLLDNDISVPEPEQVQLLGFPMEGVHLARPFELHESVQGVARRCDNNVIAGNRIDGVTEGIMVTANEPGMVCRNNVIRDNTIAIRRARPPTMPGFIRVHDATDSTVIGVPLALRGVAGESTLEDNLIEGNVIVGAEGLGIEIRNASRNRIVNNTVTGVVRREPFPGNSFIAMPLIGGDPEAWCTANGSGIWLSPGSDGNEVAGNVFEGVDGASVAREGELETDDGVRLYYRVEGEVGDTVVVVHGGPSLGHAYLAPDLLQLTRGRVVVHYDQRGIGKSTPLTDADRLTVERHVQDLEALRVHLGLGRLALLGHSWGGMLAARYAAAHPERVGRILLLDPMAPAREPFMTMASARAQEMVRARLDEAERARLDALVAVTEVDDAGAHCRALFSLLTPIYFETLAAIGRTRADFCAGSPETLRNRAVVDAAIFESLGAWDVRHLLQQVDSPVLVVHGAASAIPREAMDAWVEALPNARLLTIHGGGHYLYVDRPDAFFPAAAVFFGGGWPEHDSVELAIRGYLDAYAAMDPAILRARTTGDFLLIENGYTANLDRIVEGMDPTGPLPFTHYVLQDLEIEVADDIAVYRLAVDWYRGEYRIDGGIGTGHLRRTGDGWKLARDHMTLLPGRGRVAAALHEYVGEYRGLDTTGADDLLRLDVDDNRLFMTRPDGRPLFGGIRRLELIPDAEDTFHLEFWGALVEFERGDGGAVATLTYLPPPRTPAAYRQPLRYGRMP
jgi:parallel beta-helix repeat protein